jgi:hypothetical protein
VRTRKGPSRGWTRKARHWPGSLPRSRSGGELPSYLSNVDAAIDGGADLDEIIGVFLAIAPEIGEAAASKAAAELDAALASHRPSVP